MNKLYNAKNLTIRKLNTLKSGAMAEFGYSDAENIQSNYYQLLASISTAESLQELHEIELTESALLHE